MTGQEQIVHEQMRERRRTGIVWLVLALILAMLLGFVYRADSRADNSDKRSATLEQQVVANGKLAQDAKEGVEEANRRLRAAGKPTVPVPSVSPVSPLPSTEVPDSLTVEQVRAIVVTELASHKAELSQAEISQVARVAASMVPKPADGKTPTKAELQPMVVAALAAYCVDDKCVGKPGTDGKPGKDGTDGKDAPAVTDAQLLAAAQTALQAYCGAETHPCDGRDGTDGKDGVNGKDGRGIADTDCQEDGTWLVTYTDGTTSTSRGPCRVVIPPEKTGN